MPSRTRTSTNARIQNAVKPKKKQIAPARHWVVTTFSTSMFKAWAKLDLEEGSIRYAVYQLETTNTGRKHVQAYFEFYDRLRPNQIKVRLGDNTLHCEKRKGTRDQARDYCLKDSSSFFHVKYPQWEHHGGRVAGTDPVERGVYGKSQGRRSDLITVYDQIKAGKSEADIFESCPVQYLKYSTGIRRARNLGALKLNGHYCPITVNVIWGDSRAGKTRFVKDKHGAHNVYTPSWNGTKYWFSNYAGEKVLLINEFYGQARTAYMQELLDNYHMMLDGKGTNPISQWTTVYITSNCHPKDWYCQWAKVPCKVEDSFINRIDSVTYMARPVAAGRQRRWEDLPSLMLSPTSALCPDIVPAPVEKVGGPSITPPTSALGTSAAVISPTKPKRSFAPLFARCKIVPAPVSAGTISHIPCDFGSASTLAEPFFVASANGEEITEVRTTQGTSPQAQVPAE